MVLCGYNHQFNSINLYCCWEGMTMQLQLMDDCEEIEWKARQRNWSKEYFNSYAARKWQILTSNNSKVSWQCEVRGGHIKASVDTKLSCLHHQSKKMTNRGRKRDYFHQKSKEQTCGHTNWRRDVNYNNNYIYKNIPLFHAYYFWRWPPLLIPSHNYLKWSMWAKQCLAMST